MALLDPFFSARYLFLRYSRSNFLFFWVGYIFFICILMFKERTNFLAHFVLYLASLGLLLILSDNLWSPIDWGGGGACLGL